MPEFTVVTAFFDAKNKFRESNLEASVRRTHSVFPDARIVVAEQGNSGFVESIGLPCDHVIYESNGPFRKTAAMNLAIRKYPGSIYVMVDADVLLTESVVEFIRNHYSDGSLVFPYGDCIYLTLPDTARCSRNEPLLPGKKDHGIVIARQTGLCNVFTWDTFCRVGGYDEEFSSWGAEDDAFMIKCRRLAGPIVRNMDKSAIAYHMFHPRINTREYIDGSPLYLSNRVRCACIRRMSDDDLESYVSGRASLSEMVRKYESMGRLEVKIDWPYTKGFTLHMDATLYDIDRTGGITMAKVLDAMREEDGPADTISFIDDIKKKVTDLSDSQIAELDERRSAYAAEIRP